MSKLDAFEIKSSCDLTIQKITPLTNNAFKIICSHANRPYTNEEYCDSIAKITDQKMRVVANTIHRLNDEMFINQPHVQMIVKANLKSKSYNQNNSKGMKVIASNMFMSDEDNSIWQKVGDGEEARLVQTTDDDYEAILKARKTDCVTTASTMICDITPIEKDYVMFYNSNLGKTQFGVAASSDIIVERETCSAMKVSPEQVIASVCPSAEDVYTEVASIDTSNLSKMVDYMRVLYGNHPEFFAKLEDLIKERNSVGYEGHFNSAIQGLFSI